MTPLTWPESWISPVWPIAIVVAVGLALVVLGLLGPRLFRGSRPVNVRALFCPVRRERFDVEFQVSAWDGERVDVSRCTAFAPPIAVECGKDCVATASAGRPTGP